MKKLSLIPFLLLAVLPLALASEGSWWDKWWPFKNNPRTQVADESHPAPEESPTVTISPFELYDKHWFGESDNIPTITSAAEETLPSEHAPQPEPVAVIEESSDTLLSKEPDSATINHPSESKEHDCEAPGRNEELCDSSSSDSLSNSTDETEPDPPSEDPAPQAKDRYEPPCHSESPQCNPVDVSEPATETHVGVSENPAPGAESLPHDDSSSQSQGPISAQIAKPSSSDKITANPPQLSPAENTENAASRLNSVYAFAMNACTAGVSCVNAVFRKKEREDEQLDPTTDPIGSISPAHTHPVPDFEPTHHIKPAKKTWADKIMELSLHERFMLFHSGISFDLNEPSENTPGIFYRLAHFCKCVLTEVTRGTVKLSGKMAGHLLRPKALDQPPINK